MKATTELIRALQKSCEHRLMCHLGKHHQWCVHCGAIMVAGFPAAWLVGEPRFLPLPNTACDGCGGTGQAAAGEFCGFCHGTMVKTGDAR